MEPYWQPSRRGIALTRGTRRSNGVSACQMMPMPTGSAWEAAHGMAEWL
jgi:hypothetical protein